MKLNNKGVTIVELLVSLALLSVVLMFLYNLLSNVTFEKNTDFIANSNQANRIDIINTIENDLILDNNIEIDTDVIGVPAVNFESNLNPHYTFDNFIVGASNKFAKTSAFAVAEYPGNMYNPLFLYGNSGLGKTHLMHAIGNHIVKNSKKRVLYVTCDKFAEDFTGIHKKSEDGTNFDNMELFRKKYRDVDVLIIDEIQYLGPMTKTQQ